MQSIACPVAGAATIVSAEFAVLAGTGGLSLTASGPIISQGIAFAVLIAAYMHWFARP